MKILVTGAAGFIGFHLASALCARGDDVIGIDNMNTYYDVTLKEMRLAQLRDKPGFQFYKIDLANKIKIDNLFAEHDFDVIVNLAAQAGVRYSLENPQAYIDSNITGFTNILEACRQHQIKHLVFASSSSVYGANAAMPFSEKQHADHPLALYGATKKANEVMAHSYANLFNLPCSGLRFFTVYGPWGRPDMALFKFTKNVLEQKPIDVYNNGDMLRDFTYIDDIVAGIQLVIDNPAKSNPEWNNKAPLPDTSFAPFQLYNIGNSTPEKLGSLIEAVEKALDMQAVKNMLPMQPGDVYATHADISKLRDAFGFTPKTSLEEGVQRFVDWYMAYYQ